MSLVAHAEKELEILARRADEDGGEIDDFQREINEHLLAMIRVFSRGGHSGGSAGYSIQVLHRLLCFEPLTPLTGAPDEWMEITEEMVERPGLYQNVRCGRVFLDGKVAYDIEAVVYRDRHGITFSNSSTSGRRVRFPYMPRTRYVPAWLARPEALLARLRGRLRP